jgi:PhoPQ-activated pathogenicity-related protein
MLFALSLLACAAASPLWDYVNRDDGQYKWYDTGKKLKENGWTAYLLNVTSQAWLTPADFAGPFGHIWTHQVVVVIPEKINYPDAAALWITGNGNDGAPNQLPDATDEDLLVAASLAVTVGQVSAVLFQIPNAPIIFTADPLRTPRSEDAAVAFTWAQYMLHDRARPEWILYFPMAKAAIKAMDATTEFVNLMSGKNLTRWFTAGASKRGATTWFTGAVADPRIVGIIPIVFDVLSFKAGVQHMYETLGGWTFAFTDYRDMSEWLGCASFACALLYGAWGAPPPPATPPVDCCQLRAAS